jgi:hypothetical protein
MKSCRVSRVLRIGGLTCALLLAWSTPNALAQKWDPGVPDNLFQDGKTEGKNPRPTHRLASTKCDDCQTIVDQLQAALDDWYAMQLADGKNIPIDHTDTSTEGSEKQKAKNKQIDDAMAGLGQPNAKDLEAKQKQQKKDAKDKKDTHGSKDALAKEIKRLSDDLANCLKKCPPKEEPAVTEPGGGTTPTGGGGGKTGGEEPGTGEKPGGGVAAPPGSEVLPTLPKCWPDKATKEKFYKDLKGVDEELQSDIEMSDHFDPKRNSQGAAKILGKMKEAKALRDAAEKIKDCPEPEKTPSGKTALPGAGDSCAFLVSEGKIEIDDEGTGETIGHVADLIIENLTDQPLVCVVPPMVLESGSGKNQHYACPESQTVRIDPHRKVTVPMNGVCIARNKPPVGKGVTGDLMINEGNPAVAQNPNSHISTTDTGELLRLCSSKYKAAEKLQKDGAFKDFPYHDKQKQLDIVVQWLVWSDPRICEIAGAPPAKKEDFKKVIYKQVEEHGPMTTDTKKKIDKGADTMWDGIELAGAKAKDLEPEETPAPYGGPSILDQPQTVGMPTPTPGGKTTERPATPPPPPLPTTTERPTVTPTASVPQTTGKPTPTPTPTPATPAAKTGGKYPLTKETDCGTITISVGESGELVFDFKPKNDPKCPCKEFGWIQHISNADQEVWRYDNGVLAAVGKRTGAKSDPDKPNQPTTPPKGTNLEDWDNNPWYGGTTDRSKPQDFGEHPTPQTHVSDKPDAPGLKFKMQLVCVTTGQVLFTWEWGPLANGQQSVDKAPGKSVSPP